jgi:hypothetical protein
MYIFLWIVNNILATISTIFFVFFAYIFFVIAEEEEGGPKEKTYKRCFLIGIIIVLIAIWT